MGRFFDKWGLWIAFFLVGGVIAYGLISGLMKEEEKPPPKNAATQAAPGALKAD